MQRPQHANSRLPVPASPLGKPLPNLILVLTSAIACLVTSAGPTAAAVHEKFESPEPSWQWRERDCKIRVDAHRRLFSESHTGSGCEYFRYGAAPGGTKVLLSHTVEPARVIDELVASLWMKSDYPGLQLSVRFVLPRSKDPNTGRPLTGLLHGSSYTTPGRWQQLRVENPVALLERETRLLRSRPELGAAVDPAEAYIDTIVVNAYRGGGVTQLWLDDLEVVGFAKALRLEVAGGSRADPPAAPRLDSAPVVEVHGSLIVVGGKPFFARAIEWRGESLSKLADLGFNVVQLAALPTDEQTNEAERLQIWFVAPPPPAVDSVDDQTLRRVLCWSVGHRLSSKDLAPIGERVGQLRGVARHARRPALCHIERDVSRFAGLADVVLLERNPISSSFELSKMPGWWRRRGGSLRPAKPYWAAVQTELSQVHRDQIQMLTAGPKAADVEPAQIWLQSLFAAASGARGIIFRSDTRLDGEEPTCRRRAAALQVVNQHLQIIEPWIAAGRAGQPLQLNTPRYYASLLKTDRSQLLIACRVNADQQYVVGPGDRSAKLSVTVPGKRASDQVFRLTATGPQLLTAASVSGNIRLDNPGLFELIVLTADDQLAVNHLGRLSDKTREVLANKAVELVTLQQQETEQVLRALAERRRAPPGAQATLLQTTPLIERSRQLLLARDYGSAQQMLWEVSEQIRKLRMDQWTLAAGELPSPISSPLCTSFRMLPAQWQLVDRLRSARWGPNEMPAGGFESLDHLLATGWIQRIGAVGSARAKVELSLEAPRSGRYALKMQAWSLSGAAALEQWPAWVTSAPIPVRGGQLVRIHGWAKVPKPIQGTDGLLVFDSMTGVDQADRIRETKGWREFLLYRTAPHSGELAVVLALTGLGEVFVDDLHVSLLP